MKSISCKIATKTILDNQDVELNMIDLVQIKLGSSTVLSLDPTPKCLRSTNTDRLTLDMSQHNIVLHIKF